MDKYQKKNDNIETKKWIIPFFLLKYTKKENNKITNSFKLTPLSIGVILIAILYTCTGI